MRRINKTTLATLVVLLVLVGGAAFVAKTYFMQRPQTTPHMTNSQSREACI